MYLKYPLSWTALALAVALTGTAAQASMPANLPADQSVGAIEQVHAFHDAMPTGVSVTETG